MKKLYKLKKEKDFSENQNIVELYLSISHALMEHGHC